MLLFPLYAEKKSVLHLSVYYGKTFFILAYKNGSSITQGRSLNTLSTQQKVFQLQNTFLQAPRIKAQKVQ